MINQALINVVVARGYELNDEGSDNGYFRYEFDGENDITRTHRIRILDDNKVRLMAHYGDPEGIKGPMAYDTNVIEFISPKDLETLIDVLAGTYKDPRSREERELAEIKKMENVINKHFREERTIHFHAGDAIQNGHNLRWKYHNEGRGRIVITLADNDGEIDVRTCTSARQLDDIITTLIYG